MNKAVAKFVIKRLGWPGDVPKLESFLRQADSWMLRPISDRVEIPAFARKVLERGVVLFAVDEKGDERGIDAFYCNDLIHHVGYLTLLSVHPQCRGVGLGRQLVNQALKEMRFFGMKQARLQVAKDNRSAINLYQSCGFHEVPAENGRVDSDTFFYMQKTLETEPPK